MKAFFTENDFVKIRETGKFGKVKSLAMLIPKDGVLTYNYIIEELDDKGEFIKDGDYWEDELLKWNEKNGDAIARDYHRRMDKLLGASTCI